MTDIQIGDTVLYEGKEVDSQRRVDYLIGHKGTVVGFLGDDPRKSVEIQWNDPLPIYGGPGARRDTLVTWTQYLYSESLTLVPTPYDKRTADAIIAHMQKEGMYEIPIAVQAAFEAITAPKMETVVVEFTYPYQEDLVGALADAFDGTAFEYDVKED